MKKLTRTTSPLSKKVHGFTLLELLVAIVVLGVALSIGLPSFLDTIRNGRITAQTNQTIGMIAYARSEAAKRPGATITLCASTSTETNAPSCDSNAWEDGWFVMTDYNRDRILNSFDEDVNGNGVLDLGEDINNNGVRDNIADELLQVGGALTGGNTLRTIGFSINGALQFDSDGIPDSSGTFTLCDPRGEEEANAIILSVIGHSRIAVDEDPTADNIVNDHTGVNAVCP